MKFRIQWYERLPSTNTFLKERLVLEPALADGTIDAAREQMQGRGRRDREWISSANENLTFSLFVRTASNPWNIPSASMAAAIAVAELLEAEGVRATLKWPNDVLVGGKKICGILSEGVSGGVIIGVGLNVNMESAGHIDQPATSLLIETGERRGVDDLLEKLLPILSTRLNDWAEGGFSKLRKQWEANVPNLGKPVTVRDGETMKTGLLKGFGENGEMLLQEQSGAVTPVWAGDLSI